MSVAAPSNATRVPIEVTGGGTMPVSIADTVSVSRSGFDGGVLQSVVSLPKAVLTVSGNTVANPTVVTTEAHGLVSGDVATFTGSDSVPAISGYYPVTVIDSTTFSVPVDLTTGVSYTITGNTVANPTVVTTEVGHGLVTGDTVTISGSDSTPVIDGEREVTVINLTSFSVAVNVTEAGTTGSVNHKKAGTAGTVAITPRVVPATALANRTSMTVQNVGTTVLYLGSATVTADETTTGGYQLAAGAEKTLDLGPSSSLYIASVAAGGLACCLEVASA